MTIRRLPVRTKPRCVPWWLFHLARRLELLTRRR